MEGPPPQGHKGRLPEGSDSEGRRTREVKRQERKGSQEGEHVGSECVCTGVGGMWEKTLERRVGNRLISSLSAPSISTAISLPQATISSVDLAVASLLVPPNPLLPPSNP